MTITKLGHCCLLIEEGGLRILTDPGVLTDDFSIARNIDVLLITHEHPDHLHVPAVKEILQHSPQAKILTVRGVKTILDQERVNTEHLGHGERTIFKGVPIAGFGQKHAEIYPTVPPVDNTGFLIAERFFYPGDALVVPNSSVEILALPVAGPWLLLSQAIDYGLKIKPKVAFPVHDGMLKFTGPFHALPQREITSRGTGFMILELNKPWQV